MKDAPPPLSPTEALVLDMLIARGEMYGLAIADDSDGAIPRGTVYVTLARMVQKGFVESKAEARGPETRGMPRKLYNATGIGRRALDAKRAAEMVWTDGALPQGSW
ncbi:MAG: helix-turn-helix transcriptional regulator [Polyangiaceae bacterium]